MTAIARSLVTLIVGVSLMAGCGAAGGSSDPSASARISCVGIPPDKCDEAVASVARSLPNSNPAAIDVTCVVEACTSTGGTMDTVVTLRDGHQLHANPLTWGVDGGGGRPPPPPQVPLAPLPVEPICQGVPASMCQDMARSAVSNAGTGVGIVKIVIRCTKVPCTDQRGEGDSTVTLADGSEQPSSWGYETAQ